MKTLNLLLAATALSVSGASHAQAWSLDSCITYAHEHNIQVRQRGVDRLTAEYGVTEAKDRFLPQLSGYASQSFDFGRGLTSENTYANRNTKSLSLGANLNLPLFQGLQAIRTLDYAKINLQAAVEQVEAAKDDITLNIMAQYLQVLYNREIVTVARDQAELSQAELERRRQLLDAGKIAELDVLQAEAQLAADNLTAVNAENDLRLSLTDLAQTLQLPYSDSFDVLPLDDEPGILPSVQTVYSNALAYNHGVRAADRSVEAARANVRVAKSGYLPTLSFSAGLGSNWYAVSGFDNPAFGHQMRDNFAKRIGFSLNVPIFDAFGTRNQVRRARAAQLTAELNSDDVRTRLYNDISSAYVRAVAARNKFDSSASAVRSTEAAFHAMEEKYNYGRATATEFNETKTAWFRARSEQIQARYESLLRARILAFYNRTL